MKLEKECVGGKTIAVITGQERLITDVQSALDVIMAASHDAGANLIAIDKRAFPEEFFSLGSGLAGEILQKFVTYQVKVAIWGDYSRYTSAPLRDFIYESNNGREVYFVKTRTEAVERLARG